MKKLHDRMRKLEERHQQRVASLPYEFTTKDGSVTVSVWPQAHGGRACVMLTCGWEATAEVFLEEIAPRLPPKYSIFAYPRECKTTEEWVKLWENSLVEGEKVGSPTFSWQNEATPSNPLLTFLWRTYVMPDLPTVEAAEEATSMPN